jgi:HSP20 family molecular chaperone IbpA
MFKKEECRKCGEKVSKKYDFCPHCGNLVNGNSKKEGDLGMLGRDDNLNEFEELSKTIFRGGGNNMLNKMIGSVMKMLEKEMEKEIKRKDNQPKTNFQLFINGKKLNFNDSKNQPQENKREKIREIFLNQFSQNNIKKFSNLPRVEPTTNIRRLSDKVIYEILMPGIKSIKDISIIKLENSIELKAISKNKAYFKLIPINLPITNYGILKERLILEFGVKN